MAAPLDGFYSAHITGSSGQGLALLVFRHGAIAGVDAAGARYDGTYSDIEGGFSVKLGIWLPPNTLLVQGTTTGPEGDASELNLQLPADFMALPYVRLDAKHGPVNVKLTKLREIND